MSENKLKIHEMKDESWAPLYNVEWHKMAGNPGYDVKGKLVCHYRCWLSMNVDQLATSQLCKFTIHPAHCGTSSFSKNHKVNFPKKSRLCWQPYNHHKSLQLNNGWRGEQTFIVRGTLRETLKAHRRTPGPPRRILSVRCSLFALCFNESHMSFHRELRLRNPMQWKVDPEIKAGKVLESENAISFKLCAIKFMR